MKYGGRLIPYIFLCLFFSIEISIREPEQNSKKIKNHLSDNKIFYVDALFGYLNNSQPENEVRQWGHFDFDCCFRTKFNVHGI